MAFGHRERMGLDRKRGENLQKGSRGENGRRTMRLKVRVRSSSQRNTYVGRVKSGEVKADRKGCSGTGQ